ncbi:MAG: 2-dehydropantoate 2-reductase [Candidatus Omnitrophica bacterium]|nr:2-dehydropantoate 2-reductase [Candidatus Omnitrophota bacterium]MCM8824221.1 2-dehydropantoate 2-reductase [Candidatus Omnitrophota bacterium]MCM8827021.1 2-dehydropantoate 2-reductase [Candidatus Omnitrophota bacterium]
MRIGILGLGAIGTVIAGYLKNKKDVFLVSRKENIGIIKDKGITIRGVRGNYNLNNIKVYDKLNQSVDLAILAVKTQDVRDILVDNINYLKDSFILTVQNGIKAEEIISEFLPKEKIISTIVMFGATYLEPGLVVHNFEGDWILGKLDGNIDNNLETIADVFKESFSVKLTDKILGMKWLKLFLNANNCIPAIVNKSMQECFSNLDLCQISIGIWREGLGAVRKANIELADLPDFPVERLVKLVSLPVEEGAKIFSNIMSNLSKEPLYGSVLQSIRRNRPSEIDYLNGAFIEIGRKNSFYTPLNKRLVELVHKVEKDKEFITIEELISKTKNLIPRHNFLEDREIVNTSFPRLKLTVLKVEGDCYHGYKEKDEIILEDFTHPPKFFCLGLAHVLFPVIYALSFGARFPLQENQRSLQVTCPDGGKLTFKVEIFDHKGTIEFLPKDTNYKGPQPKDMSLEVIKSTGNCSYGYKVGDKFFFKGLKCPKDFCGAAYHCAFPALFALNFGAKFFFMENPNSIDTVTCPDGGKVVFRVKREC